MPGRDGTGPANMGAMTGRGFGFCATSARQGFMNGGTGFGFRRGCGMGFGGGRGMGRGTFGYSFGQAAPAPIPTKEALEEQVSFLESLLKETKETLAERSKGEK